MNCKQNEQTMSIKANIRKIYSWLKDDEIDNCYNMALSSYLALRCPSSTNRPDVSDVEIDFFVSQWLYKRMIDILGRAGGISLTAYRENNLNLVYGASYIDPELKKEIMPKAGIPR